MSRAQERAKEILEVFGLKTAQDLEKSLVQALKDGGNKNPQQPRLNFRQDSELVGDGVKMDIIASGEYWKWIESGRKKGERRIPADVVGKKWQGMNNIDPRQVLIQLRLKRNPKLKSTKSSLNYNKAAMSLAFVIQGSIFRKGIKPKPFVDRVLEDGRIELLAATLRKELGPLFKLEITTPD